MGMGDEVEMQKRKIMWAVRLIFVVIFLLPSWGWGANSVYWYDNSSATWSAAYASVSAVLSGADVDGDDVIEIRAETAGGTKTFWDTAITWAAADAGTSGHQVTLRPRAGDTIILSGSYDTTGYSSGWTDDGGDVWHRAVTPTQPNIVVYNGAILTLDTDVTPTANKWYWALDVLYVNVGGDPSSATAWQVGKNNYPLLIQADYVTAEDLSVYCSNSTVAAGVYIDGQTGVVLDALTVKYAGVNLIYTDTPVSSEVKYCTLSDIMKNDGTYTNCRCLYTKSSNASSYTSNTIIGGNIGFATSTGATGVNTFSGNTVYGQITVAGSARGATITHGTGWIISGNTIYNVGNTNGVSVLGLHTTTDSNSVYNNIISYIRGYGLNAAASDLNNVYGNTISYCGYKDVAGTDWLYYGGGGGGGAIWVDGTSENNNVYRNICNQNYDGIGLSCSGGAGNNAVYANLVSNSVVNCIGDYADGNPATANKFYNNTIYHNPSASNTPAYTGHGLHVQDVGGAGGKAILANNLVYNAVSNAASHCLYITDNGGLTSVQLDNNLLYAVATGVFARVVGTSYTVASDYRGVAGIQTLSAKIAGLDGVQANAEANSIVDQDPRFVSTTDFHILAGGPGIWAGTDLGIANDYDGIAFHNPPSIGAFEYRRKKLFPLFGIFF